MDFLRRVAILKPNEELSPMQPDNCCYIPTCELISSARSFLPVGSSPEGSTSEKHWFKHTLWGRIEGGDTWREALGCYGNTMQRVSDR